MNSQIVTLEIPCEVLVRNQVLGESAKRSFILDNELCRLVDICTFVVRRQFCQGEVSERGAGELVLSPCNINLFGERDCGREDTRMRDLA